MNNEQNGQDDRKIEEQLRRDLPNQDCNVAIQQTAYKLNVLVSRVWEIYRKIVNS